MGSTSLITDSSGNLLENTFYTPYGVILDGGEESRFDYTGQEYDGVIEDYDYHARRYKAEWGRFLQSDKLIFDTYNPQQLNHYAYVLNNPYIGIDPNGLWTFQIGFTYSGGAGVGGQGGVGIAIGSDNIFPNQIGVYTYAGAGPHAGVSKGGAIEFIGSGNKYLSDLGGMTTTVGGSAGEGILVGVEANIPHKKIQKDGSKEEDEDDEKKIKPSYSLTIGPGVEAFLIEGHSHQVYTTVSYVGSTGGGGSSSLGGGGYDHKRHKEAVKKVCPNCIVPDPPPKPPPPPTPPKKK